MRFPHIFPRIFPRKVKFLSDTHIECEGRFDRFDIEVTVTHQPNYRHKYTASVSYKTNDGWRPYDGYECHGETERKAIINLIQYAVEYREIDFNMKVESKKTILFSVEGSELK